MLSLVVAAPMCMSLGAAALCAWMSRYIIPKRHLHLPLLTPLLTPSGHKGVSVVTPDSKGSLGCNEGWP